MSEQTYKPTAAMVAAAKRGLELRREHGRGGLTTQQAGQQGIGSGVARATAIAAGKSLPLETVKRMKAYFDRHQGDKSAEGWGSTANPSNGYIAWLLWGGDAGRSWASGIVERAQAEERVQKTLDAYAGQSWRYYCLWSAGESIPAPARAELLRKAQVFGDNAMQIEQTAERLGMPIRKAHKLAGRMRWRGLDISIENAVGGRRQWYDPHNGESGETVMEYAYGYIRGTEAADGEHVDVYVGPDLDAPEVYVVHQNKAPDFDRYDEDKVMLGFPSADAAKAAYLRHYNDERFYGGMTATDAETFADRCRCGEIKGKITHKSFGATVRAAFAAWRAR